MADMNREQQPETQSPIVIESEKLNATAQSSLSGSEAIRREAVQMIQAGLKSESAEENGKPDPFDPASLRVSNNLATGFGVKKLLTTVPVRKPEKTWFVRVHPDPEYQLVTTVIELKDERGEFYLVLPCMREALLGESTFGMRRFCVAINTQGVVFLWPLKLPHSSGRTDDWSRSSAEAAEMAMKNWVRVQSNMSSNSYEVFLATGALADPVWPSQTMRQLLEIAFRDRVIESPDHPILRKLRGEI